MNIYNEIKKIIIDVLSKKLGSLNENVLGLITCEQPKNLKFGDISTNALMILKKNIKDNEEEIKNTIISELKSKKIFEDIIYVKPGFINFKLKKNLWFKVIRDVIQNDQYGLCNIGLNKKVNIEFISANPTGPLHVGHLRGAVFGDVLARLMEKNGYKITREYYMNDVGNQIQVLHDSVKFHIEKALNLQNIKKPSEMYNGKYIVSVANEILKEKKNSQNADILKKIIIDKIIKLIKRDLANLGITFDTFISEKSLHDMGLLKASLKKLEKSNLLYEGTLEKPKGAEFAGWKPRKQLLFKSTFYGDTSDRAIKKSDGSWTYFASDIAYHHFKVDRGFDEIINIWGADHAGYVKRIEASLLAMGHKKIKFDVKLCQIVNLLEDNKTVKMSKRAGNFILIDDILKKIDKDVVRFFMLIRKNDAHLDFDLKKCLEETKENPIFYIQYAIARINSLNKFFKEKDLKFKGFNQKLFNKFNNKEINLLKSISLWPKVIETSVTYKEPHRVVYYLIELAAALHNYWSMGNLDSTLRVINEGDAEQTEARLTLLNCISKVIRSGFDILSIKPLERM